MWAKLSRAIVELISNSLERGKVDTFLGQETLNRPPAKLQHSCDLSNGGTVLLHRFRTAPIKDDMLSTQLLSPVLSALNPSPDTLSDQFPFEFRHRGEDMQQQTCRGVCIVRIDTLRDSKEPYAIRSQGFDTIQAITNRTTKAVKFPNEHSIKAS
jgi:hypothetical protein